MILTLARLRVGLPAAALATAAPILLAWRAFTAGGLLLDPSLALAASVLGGATATLARYLLAERDARRLRHAFAHYLSPSLVDALARDPGRLRLGGELRPMTFLFTDLEGFTSLVETADPTLIVSLLNQYLDGLCSIAMDHGGTVDKIVGDAVHLMFNAPLDQPDHASRGVHCALAMDVFAQNFAEEQRSRGIAFGVTRIGVNTGPAVVGNFGGSRRFDYTAHGDAINVAARLEAANKTLGIRICVARSTVDEVAGIAFLPVGSLMLKGKRQPLEAFMPEAAAGSSAWGAAYRELFARLAAGDEAAALDLLALHARHPDQPLLAMQARRMRAGDRTVRLAA